MTITSPPTRSPVRRGWRRSRWLTFAEVLLGLTFAVGLLGSLLAGAVATVTFLGEPVTSSMLADQTSWEHRAMWFGVAPSAAGVLLAALGRRRSAGVVFGLMLGLGLLVVVGFTQPEPVVDFFRQVRSDLFR